MQDSIGTPSNCQKDANVRTFLESRLTSKLEGCNMATDWEATGGKLKTA